jgi:hypothetical protein
MNIELEWSIRSKIADLQIFLTSGAGTDADRREIDAKLEQVLEIVNRLKTGGSTCEAC